MQQLSDFLIINGMSGKCNKLLTGVRVAFAALSGSLWLSRHRFIS
jgi:hypothetical protein